MKLKRRRALEGEKEEKEKKKDYDSQDFGLLERFKLQYNTMRCHAM